MNYVLASAAAADPALGEGASCVFVTPRFQASRHVVAVVVKDGTPRLVAKIARDPNGGEALAHEARSLRGIRHFAVEHHCPQIVDYVAAPAPMLLETYIGGTAMSPDVVRSRPAETIGATSEWLLALHRSSQHAADSNRIQRSIADPLARFLQVMRGHSQAEELVADTLCILAPLSGNQVPLVMEHGDLSHPNLLLDRDGKLGVIDWELSDAGGLPLTDLCFFLSYVAFARHRAGSLEGYRMAFRAAWKDRDGWAWPHLMAAARQLGLERVARPLFVLTWARYVAGFAARLSTTVHAPETRDRVAACRYFHLWRDAVAQVAATCAAAPAP